MSNRLRWSGTMAAAKDVLQGKCRKNRKAMEKRTKHTFGNGRVLFRVVAIFEHLDIILSPVFNSYMYRGVCGVAFVVMSRSIVWDSCQFFVSGASLGSGKPFEVHDLRFWFSKTNSSNTISVSFSLPNDPFVCCVMRRCGRPSGAPLNLLSRGPRTASVDGRCGEGCH